MQLQRHSGSQSFRGTIDRISPPPFPAQPPDCPSADHDERQQQQRSRDHVLALLQCQFVEGLHPCSFCELLLLQNEREYWCDRGAKKHVPWDPLPDDMQKL